MLTTSEYEVIQNLQEQAHTYPLTVDQSMTGVGQDGWVVEQVIHDESGFDAVIFRNDTTHQFLYAAQGRDDVEIDSKAYWASQLQDTIPATYYDAAAHYSFLKTEADSAGYQIVLSGHSQSGIEISLLAAKLHSEGDYVEAVNFNPVANNFLLDSLGVSPNDIDPDKIINFVSESDIVSAPLRDLLIGSKYYLDPPTRRPGESDIDFMTRSHFLQSMDLSTADKSYDKSNWLIETIRGVHLSIAAGSDTIGDAVDGILSEHNRQWQVVEQIFKNAWDKAESTIFQGDPLILDLNDDGLVTTSLDDGKYFDMDGNSFAERNSWVSKDDGFLVRDINNNGQIDNGSEMFGNQTALTVGGNAADGFAALSDLDSNHDGVIDANDTYFSELKVLKGDGSLVSLTDLNITSINLSSSAVNTVDANGNTLLSTATYTTSDSQTHTIGDFELQADTADSVEMNYVEVSSTIQELPDAQGMGNVNSLHQAMAKDTTGNLQDLVESFVSSTDPVEQNSLLSKILAGWAGVTDDTSFRSGAMMYATHAAIAEQFIGHDFNGVSNGFIGTVPAGSLSQGYYQLSEGLYASLMSQSQLKDYYDAITWNESNEPDFSSVTGMVQDLATTDSNAAITVAGELARMFNGFSWQTEAGYSDFYSAMVTLGPDYQFAVDTAGKQVIEGTSGNDTFGSEGTGAWDTGTGSYTRDTQPFYLDGGAGNDDLQGSYNNDILIGGTGNDTLRGFDGDDSYYFGAGDGQDEITEGNYYLKGADGGNDTLYFKGGLTVNDIAFSVDGDSIVASIKGTSDSIKIWHELDAANPGYLVENIVFDDGTVVTSDQLTDMLQVYGTSSNDNLSGSDYNETIIGNAGNDFLFGFGGNDTLIGNTGNDYLDGGLGDDTYVVSAGDGNDEILDGTSTGGGNDTLKFDGLNLADVAFSGNFTTALFATINGTDQIRIDSELDSSASDHWIENFQFADATLTRAQVLNLLSVNGTSGDDFLGGSSWNETIRGYAGNDHITGGDGNDTLIGGTGNDYLDAGEGDDTYIYNLGDGQDTIDDGTSTGGNDTLVLNGISKDDVTFSGDFSNNLIISINGTTDKIQIDSGLSSGSSNRWIETYQFDDGTLSRAQVIDIMSTIQGTSGNDSLNGSINADHILGNDGDDTIYGNGGNDTLEGGNGNDYITGEDGADYLSGGAGNDSLYGKDGNDTLVGGTGNDIMDGRDGDDTFIFNAGDGQDTISDGLFSGGNDVLQFNGLNQDDVTIGSNGSDLVISINGTSDKIVISSDLDASSSQRWIESYQFDDGTLDRDQILGLLTINGTSGGDFLSGSSYSEHINCGDGGDAVFAGDGNDTINCGDGDDWFIKGENGNDSILGEAGNDDLYGGSGNDTLVGGIGNDDLEGDDGDDTYSFGAGDGHDTISDGSSSIGDRVVFDNTVNQSDIAIFKDGSGNLQIAYTSGGDQITINSFDNANNTIESFELANGNSMSDADINQIISDMAAYASTNSISISSLSDVENNAGLMALVAGGWHA